MGDSHAVEVPDGADPALAAALGIAGLAGWLPFAWRAPLRGSRTSSCWAPRLGRPRRHAGRRAARCRSRRGGWIRQGLERAVEHGADATVRLDESDDLVAVFKDVFGGAGPSYVFDPLWGAPAAAAVEAAVPRATIVNLGQSAGATSELSSAAVRFKSLSILGHTNFACLPPNSRASTGGSSARPSPATSISTWIGWVSTR